MKVKELEALKQVLWENRRNPAKRGEILAMMLVDLEIDPKIIKGHQDARNKIDIAIRLRAVDEAGIKVGSVVEHTEEPGRSFTVKSINSKVGWVFFEGKAGAFNPLYLKLVKAE
jgi:hypothetical protein